MLNESNESSDQYVPIDDTNQYNQNEEARGKQKKRPFRLKSKPITLLAAQLYIIGSKRD